MERKIKVGQKAPNIRLKDQDGIEFNLYELRGRKVLLSFHPLAWTSVCNDQMADLEKNRQRLSEFNIVPVGISVDPVASKKAWADDLGIKDLALLSDFWPHGRTASDYGIFRKHGGISERANIIVDENKNIIFFKVYDIKQLPDMEEIINFLRSRQRQPAGV
jgi:peroxiredoxin